MAKKKLPNDVEIVYYFYYHGDIDFANRVEEYITNKRYDKFMEEYKNKKENIIMRNGGDKDLF